MTVIFSFESTLEGESTRNTSNRGLSTRNSSHVNPPQAATSKDEEHEIKYIIHHIMETNLLKSIQLIHTVPKNSKIYTCKYFKQSI